jgi:Uma2 family endonuclease
MASTPLASDAAQRPVSFEDFLAWAPDDAQAEWVDGEVLLMSPASTEHQRLHGFLYRLIAAYVEARRLGEVLWAPFLMRLATRPSGREPDIIFVAGEHADRLKETYLDGPADLVVEIVSPDSDARDRGDKFVEYEAAGIPEYWLIDLPRQEAWFYQRGGDGRYHAVPPRRRRRLPFGGAAALPSASRLAVAAPAAAGRRGATPNRGLTEFSLPNERTCSRECLIRASPNCRRGWAAPGLKPPQAGVEQVADAVA